MRRGPAYTDNELIILTLLGLMVATIVVGIVGVVTHRIYKAYKSRGPGNAAGHIEPA
jgi:Tfp pilus assembly protein PilE